MKMLLEHMVYFRWKVVEHFDGSAAAVIGSDSGDVGDSVVVYINIEANDLDGATSARAARIIDRVAKELEVANIVLYPFAHLEHSRVDENAAIIAIRSLNERLHNMDSHYYVLSVPFGAIKTREGKTHAHRRAVLLRTVR